MNNHNKQKFTLVQNFRLITLYAKNVKNERGFKKARVFFLRSLLFSLFSFKWMGFIDQYYKKYGFPFAPWTLIGLPIRSYVTANLSIKKRIKLMTDHYLILSEYLNEELLKKILSGEVIRMSELKGKNGEIFSINIAILDRYWREGGLTIFMTDEENNIITTLTFNFGKTDNGDNFAIIGGLQGTILGKSKIVSTTRTLNGLRPKYAVLEALYAIAPIFKADSIIASSLSNHIFKRTSLMKKIHSDYDEFWLEVGGVADRKNDNFLMPKSLPKRTIDEVQSKRKKDWLKRQEYLEQIKTDSIIPF